MLSCIELTSAQPFLFLLSFPPASAQKDIHGAGDFLSMSVLPLLPASPNFVLTQWLDAGPGLPACHLDIKFVLQLAGHPMKHASGNPCT